MNSFEHALLGIALFIVFMVISAIWNKLTNKAVRDTEDKIYEEIADRISKGEKVEYTGDEVRQLATFLAKGE